MTEPKYSPEVEEAIKLMRQNVNSIAEDIERQEAKKRNPRSRSLTGPRPRHVRAEATFNGNPAQVARWDAAVEQAKQPDGKIRLTADLIQLAILAYYAQRKLDVAAGNSEETGSDQP